MACLLDLRWLHFAKKGRRIDDPSMSRTLPKAHGRICVPRSQAKKVIIARHNVRGATRDRKFDEF